jgi:hypothetical protein
VSTTDNLDFLINDFVDRLPEVSHAVAVSADGLLVARNRDLPQDQAEQAAAACSGLVSLLRGTGGVFGAGTMESNMVMYERGFMFVVAISDGASLLALATRHADTGLVSHELAALIGRAGPMLTPAARALPSLVDQQQPAGGSGPAMRGAARR